MKGLFLLDEAVIGSGCRESLIREAVETERCFVVDGKDEIAAYTIFNFHFFDRFFIELLIVGETHRRKGYGGMLLEFLKEYGSGEAVFTSTNSSNTPMQRLLEKTGFSRCGLIDKLDEGDPEGVYCFEKHTDTVCSAVPGVIEGGGKQIDIGFLRGLAKESGLSGVVQMDGPSGLIYREAFGLANQDWGIPNNIGTRFNTASISKVFTACGILKLAEQGLLSLEDKLKEYLQFDGDPFSGEITLAHLLTHTSGIADDADEEAGESYEEIFVNKPNYRFREAADLVENFIGRKPVFEPGAGCRYNNAGYVLLGMVIEKVTGVEYRKWMTDNILIPWGLDCTCFPAMDEVNANTAEGYVCLEEETGTRWKKNIYSIPPVGTPEGGIYSTAGDLVRLLRGLASGGFFTPEYSRLILTPKVLHSDYGSFQHWMGFGLEFYMDGDRILRIQKDGSNPGVSAVMAYYPGSDTTVVILSNNESNVWQLHRKIDEKLGLSRNE